MKNLLETEKLEVGLTFLFHRLMNFRSHLKDILSRYNAESPEELKNMIESGKIDAHPSYEDYLDAIGFRIESESLLREIEARIQKIKSTI